jgi:hypothetical protein
MKFLGLMVILPIHDCRQRRRKSAPFQIGLREKSELRGRRKTPARAQNAPQQTQTGDGFAPYRVPNANRQSPRRRLLNSMKEGDNVPYTFN